MTKNEKTGLIIITLLIGAALISIYEADSETGIPVSKTSFGIRLMAAKNPVPLVYWFLASSSSMDKLN